MAKTDVKARAHEQLERIRASVARPQVLGPAAAVAVGLLAWRLIRP